MTWESDLSDRSAELILKAGALHWEVCRKWGYSLETLQCRRDELVYVSQEFFS